MSDRIRKINELIREEGSRAISQNISSNNLLTVTAVETTDDLKQSVIWVSVMGDEKKALSDLEANKSDIQHQITSKMATKYTPKIEFRIDHSQEYVLNIERLLYDDHRKE